MIIKITVTKEYDENENEEELKKLPYGSEKSATSFRYSPSTNLATSNIAGEATAYLKLLQEALGAMLHHETVKTIIYLQKTQEKI